MADHSKPQPTFSFGQATSSSGGKGLFGSTTSSALSSGGLFGSATPASTSTGGGMLGSTPTSSAPPGSFFGAGTGGLVASSPFGGAGNGSNLFANANKPAAGGGFNFGPSTNTSSASGGLFGSSQPNSQAGQTASTAPSASLFSTPNKPTDTGASSQTASNPFGAASGGSGLFGNRAPSSEANSTTPTNKQPPSLFGNSTTPAGPPPGASSGAGSNSLFSFSKPEGQSNTSSSNLPSGSDKASGDSSSGKRSMPTLFAPSSDPTADLDKPKGSQASSQASNIFGAPSSKANSGSGIFGSNPPAPQSQPQTGLFNNLTQSQDAVTSKTAENKPSPNLFSNLASPSASNSQTANTTSAPSMFANVQKQPSAPSISFSNPASTAAASSGMVKSPTAAPSMSLFGNIAASNAATSSGASAPSTNAPKASFFPSLGKPQDKSVDTISTTSSTLGPSSTPALNAFGNIEKPSDLATTSQSQAPSTTAATNASKSNTTNLGASTAGPIPPARSRLKDKTMDDIITRWASDLSKYQKEFQTQAEKVASWDRMLVENSEKIQRLYGSTLEAERATTEVERQLTSVEGDQAELESWLNHYETEVDNMIQNQVGQGEGLSGPDQERERTYQLAAKLSDRLDGMGKDLGSMIEEINDASSNLSKHAKSDDPLTQVVRVLNSHLTQLQQIDQGATSLQLKVKEAHRAAQSIGPPNGLNGPSSDAAEGFYRSYMGRG